MISNDKVQITLRLPKEMNKAIKIKAKEMGLSVNAYILTILNKEL